LLNTNLTTVVSQKREKEKERERLPNGAGAVEVFSIQTQRIHDYKS
jgi:hypothetical protein